MMTFSSIYRKRKAVKSASLEPWFPPHLQRDIYLSLLHMEPEEGDEKTPKVPHTMIKAALVRRAIEDIKRIIQLRTTKQALSVLLQRGSIGDDLWQRFLRAEQEMELELRDVVKEANALQPGWGQIIFQTANEINQNDILRKQLSVIEEEKRVDVEWWEKRRGEVEAELLSEAPVDSKAPGTTPAKPTPLPMEKLEGEGVADSKPQATATA